MAYTLANAVKGTFPDFEIDYTKVLISQGALAPASASSAVAEDRKIKLSWDDNSGFGNAKATDQTLVVAVNPSRDGDTISLIDGAKRADQTQILDIPTNWVGTQVQVYLGFVSEDGKEVANSTHFSNVFINV
jgi:hypothetical protein